MIKKMVNWSFGAFFRTIGRIFGYLVIGVLIMLIGAKIGFKSFFMPVKAATSGLDKYDYRFWPVSCSAQGRNCTLGPGSGFLSDKTYYDLTAQYSSILQFNIRTWAGSNVYKENNTYTFRYTVQVANKTTLLDNMDQINKSVKFIEMYTATASSPSNATQDDMNVDIKFTDATGSTDKVYLYIKFSPNKDIKWWGVTFQVGKEGGDITLFPFSDIEKIRYINAVVTYEEGVGAIIDKKTDEIIKGQDKIDDTLNDDDTSEADSKITGFFNDFADNSHGLSSIVTAPLNAVNAMLTTTCTAPSATYKGSTFSLPCGSILWEQEGASALKTFINLIYGGLICYGIVKSLFKDVNDLKNPENDKVDVMNL